MNNNNDDDDDDLLWMHLRLERITQVLVVLEDERSAPHYCWVVARFRRKGVSSSIQPYDDDVNPCVHRVSTAHHK